MRGGLLCTGAALAAALAGSASQGRGQDATDAASPAGHATAFFEDEVRPLLVEKCIPCHDASHVGGGLRLDARAAWQAGGFSGPAIVPGDPDASLLIRTVRADDRSRMPPDTKLDDGAIAALERWVAMGAPDPRDEDAARAAAAPQGPRGSAHWAFRPLADVDPPAVEREEWVRNEIDRFVLARLEAEGLAPAPEADRRTLLRRVSFDLLGLPPTPEEIEAFERDDAPDAYERLVERLLASPHYGERWGRRWLDVTRYADSNGSGANLAMAHAWEYRDWVVRAFNQDLPYDRFLTEQLAGDLLPDAPAAEADSRGQFDRFIATAFLVLGPKNFDEVDKEQLAMDVVDEQIDVVSKAFLGLTVACARCHDHKFDPVTAGDYYALAGIFKSTSAMEQHEASGDTPAQTLWRELQIATAGEIAEREAWERSIAQLESEIQATLAEASAGVRATWTDRLADYLLAGQATLEEARFIEAEDFARSNLTVDADRFGTPDTAIVRTAAPGVQYAEYEIDAPRARRVRLDARFAAVKSRPVRVLLGGKLVREDGLGETTASWDPSTQTWFEVATLDLRPGTNLLRLERDDGFPHVDELLLVPADFDARIPEGLAPGVVRNWASLLDQSRRRHRPLFALWHELAGLDAAAFPAAARAAFDAPDARLAGMQGPPPGSLAELASRYQQAITATVSRLAADRGKAPGAEPSALEAEALDVLQGPNGPFVLPASAVEPFAPPAIRAALDEKRSRLQSLRSREPHLHRTLAAAEAQAVDLPVHFRGDHLRLAATPTPRGVPALFEGIVPSPSIPAGASGRLQLARWLTHPDHPLTARVMVNRVWQGHFGEGLVRSPSNFGLRGGSPSHPELLDWLARRFVRDGWSLKSLHRRILLSSTYRMQSSYDAATAARDPENRLLWRQNRRRLEAEPLRDALLAVSGRLDLSVGGSLLATPNAKPVSDVTAETPIDYSPPRRSLYLPVIRNSLYGFFSSFDFGDPEASSGQRQSTTTVQQALALMNDPLVIESSEAVARTVLAQPAAGGERQRVDRLYTAILGRPPRAAERTRALAFLEEMASRAASGHAVGAAAAKIAGRGGGDAVAFAPARLRAWRGLAQVLLSSNEFLYVD